MTGNEKSLVFIDLFNRYHYPVISSTQIACDVIVRVYFRKEAATVFKARLSLKEKAKGLLTHHRHENAAGVMSSTINTRLSLA